MSRAPRRMRIFMPSSLALDLNKPSTNPPIQGRMLIVRSLETSWMPSIAVGRSPVALCVNDPPTVPTRFRKSTKCPRGMFPPNTHILVSEPERECARVEVVSCLRIRCHRLRLVEPNPFIELTGQGCLKVMTENLSIRPIDNADRSLQAR